MDTLKTDQIRQPGDLNYKTGASDAHYKDISANDSLRWRTTDPEQNDEVFIWCQMIVYEDIADITSINFTFVGYPDSGTWPVSIWAFNNSTPAWDQIGTSMSIASGADSTMTRSITSDFADYIDSVNLSIIDWGVYLEEDRLELNINYVEMVVTTASGSRVYNYTTLRSAAYSDIAQMPLPRSTGKGDIMVGYPPNDPDRDVSYKNTAADWNFKKMYHSDDIWWNSSTPSGSDEVFMWQQMQISEDPATITEIELLFEGFGHSDGIFTVWLFNNSITAPTSGWEQIGGNVSVLAFQEVQITRILNTSIASYIDTANLSIIDWGVWFSTHALGEGRNVGTDFVALNLTTQ